MQPNRLLGTAVTLESVLAWCVAETSQDTAIIFRYTFNEYLSVLPQHTNPVRAPYMLINY